MMQGARTATLQIVFACQVTCLEVRWDTLTTMLQAKRRCVHGRAQDTRRAAGGGTRACSWAFSRAAASPAGALLAAPSASARAASAAATAPSATCRRAPLLRQTHIRTHPRARIVQNRVAASPHSRDCVAAFLRALGPVCVLSGPPHLQALLGEPATRACVRRRVRLVRVEGRDVSV